MADIRIQGSLLAAGLALASFLTLSLAIVTPATGQGLGQVERDPELPAFSDPADSPVQLPPPPAVPDDQQLSAGIAVFVRQIKLTGNSVFPAAELEQIAAAYENRTLSSEELQALRLALTRHYVEHGYVNSGAVIPDQSVDDGIVEMQLVEGRLSEVIVEGDGRLRGNYVANRLAHEDAPLNINRLQEDLQILLQSPVIERVNSELGPGDRPGEAVLRTRLREASLLRLGAAVDNKISPSLGEMQAVVSAELRNPSGFGDLLHAEAGLAEGLEKFRIDYALPVNRHDTRLLLGASFNDADVVLEPFDAIGVESKTREFSIGVSHPIYRTSRQQLHLGLRFDRRNSRTFLLDRQQAFSPELNATDGESDVSVLRLSADWLSRSRVQVFAARSTLSVGFDAFGATINDGGLADGEFIAWLGQFQWARRFGERGTQLVFRADAQLSDGPLLPLEKFAVGGADSVRGYRLNQLVRDEGFSSSLEVRVPVLRDVNGRSTLQLAAFADAGGAFNDGGSNPNPDLLWSAGLGVRFDPHPDVHGEVYWAHAFEDVDNPNDSIQDSGIHFRFQVGHDLF